MFWIFGHKTCGISAPQLGIEPALLTLEGEVPTTGFPRKWSVFYFSFAFLYLFFFLNFKIFNSYMRSQT